MKIMPRSESNEAIKKFTDAIIIQATWTMVQHVKCAMFIQTFLDALQCIQFFKQVEEKKGKKLWAPIFRLLSALEQEKSCLKKSGSSLKKVTVDEERREKKNLSSTPKNLGPCFTFLSKFDLYYDLCTLYNDNNK